MDNDLFPDIADRISSLSEKIPPYLEKVGLTHPPFDSTLSENFYYEDPIRMQRFNLLLHLAQFSDLIHIIVGPSGSGKTALLQRLDEQTKELWHSCQIQASNQTTFEQVLTQLGEVIDLSEQTPINQLLPAIVEQLNAFYYNTKRAVLLIDDAHQLPDTTLSQLITLTEKKSEDGKSLIHLILTGEGSLSLKVEQLLAHKGSEQSSKVLTLSPFTLEQTRNYVNHRLQAAELSGESPFTEKDIRWIFKESAGLPGRINKLAHQALLNAPEKGATLSLLLTSLKPKRLGTWLTIAAILIVATPVILFQEEINALFEPQTAQQEPAKELGARLEKPLSLPLADVVEHKPAAKETVAEAAITMDVPEVPATAPTAVAPPTEITMPDVTMEATPVVEETPMVTQPEKIMEISTAPAPIVTVDTQQRAKPIKLEQPPTATLSDIDWIRQQPGTHFTLQLLATPNRDAITSFIKRNQLKEATTATYMTLRDGKEWFALVYGNYPNRAMAMTASDELRTTIKGLEPWPRSFTSIHKILPATP